MLRTGVYTNRYIQQLTPIIKMKKYLPILVIIISILSCSKEGEPADDKVNEGIVVEKSTLRDIPLDNGIDSLDTIERVKDSIDKVKRARLDSIDKVEKAKLQSELDSLKLVEEQKEKINELLTYLENPIEANYNYKWNDNISYGLGREYRVDPKVDSVLSLVSSKRKKILMNEFINYIDDPVDSNYREEWEYNLKRTDDNIFDSLMLLAYYSGHEDFLKLDSSYFRDNEYIKFDTIVIEDVTCFPKINLDTLFFGGGVYCSFKDPLYQKLQMNGGYFYFDLRDQDLRILGYNFDITYGNYGGCGDAWNMLLFIKQANGNNGIFKLCEGYSYPGSEDSFDSKLTFDGKISVRISKKERGGAFFWDSNNNPINFDVDYNIILDYELNDSLDLEFKGIRMIDEINHY